jgi:hypothetical protein
MALRDLPHIADAVRRIGTFVTSVMDNRLFRV